MFGGDILNKEALLKAFQWALFVFVCLVVPDFIVHLLPEPFGDMVDSGLTWAVVVFCVVLIANSWSND